jgi:hypothetical protein
MRLRFERSECGKQKTDRQDAELILRLLLEDRFPWDYEQMRKFGSHAGQPGNETPISQAASRYDSCGCAILDKKTGPLVQPR